MTGWWIAAVVLGVAGMAGLAWVLLSGRTRQARPGAHREDLVDRPGVDDQFGTWPTLRIPDPPDRPPARPPEG